MTSQGQERRFTDDFRCPICEGSPTDPRGQGQRCYGYRTDDWVYCTREDRAGAAPFEPSKGAYVHKARGACKCGVEHAPDNEPARKPRRGRLIRVDEYPYLDAANNENFKVIRFVDESTGEKTFRQTHWDKQSGGYARGRGPEPLILYKLDMLAKAPAEAVVWIVEGEKDVNRLNKLGLLATCNPMGAGKWKDFFATSLADRTCVILPDNDQVGKDHAKDVARSLQKTAKSVKIVDLPNLPEKGDVSDWLDAGNTVDRLRDLAAVAPELLGVDLGPPPAKEKPAAKKGTLKPGPQPSQTTTLIKIAQRATYWRSETKEAYASVPAKDGAIEHVPVASSAFVEWLTWAFWEDQDDALQSEAIGTVRGLAAAWARFHGESGKPWLRVAGEDGGAKGPVQWIDLGDDQRRVVRVTAEGWEIVQSPPIRFLRPGSTQPMPVPERGGSLNELWEFVNIDDHSRPILIAALTMAFRPKGPYPIMILNGEQGCAKSTTNEVLKHLVDPRTPMLGTMQDSPRELFVDGTSNWFLAYDNISSLNKTQSNACCQMATGGGMSLRKLHTDMEVTILDVCRPMILNGIDEFAKAPDLVDRSILLNCPLITGANRRAKAEFWKAFHRSWPRILGALCDAIAAGLAIQPTVKLASLPRMADFAVWGEAVWRGLGHPEGEFMAAYLANRDAFAISTLEDSLIADALFDLGRGRRYVEWEDTVKKLLDDLRSTLPNGVLPGAFWPRSPQSLTSHLRRIAQPLRTAGIHVAFSGKTRRGRVVRISWDNAESPGETPF